MTRRAVKRAILLPGALLIVSLAAGCGASSPGREIDVAALQRELATVIHQQKLAEGYDVDVHALCTPTGSDGLAFSCHIDAASFNRPTNSWTEIVSCLTPGTPGQRCSSSSGYSLQ